MIIREAGLDSDMRNMAGTFAGGISAAQRDKETSLMNPPPGLGSVETDEEKDERDETSDEWQEKSQIGARFADRHARRSP